MTKDRVPLRLGRRGGRERQWVRQNILQLPGAPFPLFSAKAVPALSVITSFSRVPYSLREVTY